MKMKAFPILLVLLQLAAFGAERPNIILILTDDQDKESIGAYGGDVWTPHLDRMAQEGMLFHNAFVTSTVCTPSRYSFLTGRYASRSWSETFLEECPEGTQAFPAFNVGLEHDNLNVGAMLSKAGYRTGYVGKFHASGVESLRTPADFEAHGLKPILKTMTPSPEVSAAFKYNERVYRKILTDRGFDWAKNIYLGNMEKPYAEHNLEWTVEAALEFIDESARDAETPFYLHFCTTLVHGPDASWNRSLEHELITGEGEIEQAIRPEGMRTRSEILAELKQRNLDPDKGHAGYSWVDAGVGAILDKLKRLGIDDNTLVIFTADHGSQLKGSLYDIDGACVPFLARWPKGIAAGIESNELVQSIDIAATAFDYGKASLPHEYVLDGRSLNPLFSGSAKNDWRDHVYLELGFGRAIRSQNYKYISIRYTEEHLKALAKAPPAKLPAMLAPLNRSGIGVRGAANPNFYYDDALFQVNKDPRELKNLVSDPEHKAELERMQALLLAELDGSERPYGEFIPGGNAQGAGKAEALQKLTRQMRIQGKRVFMPDGTEVSGQRN